MTEAGFALTILGFQTLAGSLCSRASWLKAVVRESHLSCDSQEAKSMRSTGKYVAPRTAPSNLLPSSRPNILISITLQQCYQNRIIHRGGQLPPKNNYLPKVSGGSSTLLRTLDGAFQSHSVVASDPTSSQHQAPNHQAFNVLRGHYIQIMTL